MSMCTLAQLRVTVMATARVRHGHEKAQNEDDACMATYVWFGISTTDDR